MKKDITARELLHSAIRKNVIRKRVAFDHTNNKANFVRHYGASANIATGNDYDKQICISTVGFKWCPRVWEMIYLRNIIFFLTVKSLLT